MIKVYVQEPVKVGQPITGWDTRRNALVHTTPVAQIERVDGALVAKTEYGGKYLLTTRR